MTGNSFVDTNILLYALAHSGDPREARARAFLLTASESEDLWVSSQVQVEFSANLVRKLGLSGAEALAALAVFEGFGIVPVGSELIERALRAMDRHRLSFWDSLIVVAALEANCTTLYSEDLQDGMRIEGLRIVNPLKAA